MKRLISLAAAAAAAAMLTTTAGAPALAATEATQPSFGISSSSSATVSDILQFAVNNAGYETVAAVLDSMATARATLPGLEGMTPTARQAALSLLAHEVEAGVVPTAGPASRFVAPADAASVLSATEGPDSERVKAAQAQARTLTRTPGSAATTMSVGPGVKANGPVSGGFAWQMSDYLLSGYCSGAGCVWNDRVDFRFTINGRVQTSKIDMTFNKVGNGEISQYVTVKAETRQAGVTKGYDEDEWFTPGTGTGWPRTDTSMLGKTISFKMTFTAITPYGVASGTGSTTATKACTSGGCNW